MEIYDLNGAFDPFKILTSGLRIKRSFFGRDPAAVAEDLPGSYIVRFLKDRPTICCIREVAAYEGDEGFTPGVIHIGTYKKLPQMQIGCQGDTMYGCVTITDAIFLSRGFAVEITEPLWGQRGAQENLTTLLHLDELEGTHIDKGPLYLVRRKSETIAKDDSDYALARFYVENPAIIP